MPHEKKFINLYIPNIHSPHFCSFQSRVLDSTESSLSCPTVQLEKKSQTIKSLSQNFLDYLKFDFCIISLICGQSAKYGYLKILQRGRVGSKIFSRSRSGGRRIFKKKTGQKGIFRHFLENVDQKIAFFRRALLHQN